MPKEILKPETKNNQFDEEETDDSKLNQIIEEERKGAQKEFTIDERTGEVLTEQETKDRIEKGIEK